MIFHKTLWLKNEFLEMSGYILFCPISDVVVGVIVAVWSE
jgi:hypothetical protein